MTQTKPSLVRARIGTAFTLAVLICATLTTNAAISVGPAGTGVLTFNALPPVTEWSTLSIAGGGADIHTLAQLDAAVQLRSAADIATVLGSSPTLPPSANAVARWNSAGLYLQSRPTGNNYTILMAKLQNDIGSDADAVTISFDFNLLDPVTLELPGLRVYYSLNGTPGSWQVLEAISDKTTAQTLATNVTLATLWPAGGTMYLLFADDNADTATDESYTLDNFSMSATAATLAPIIITNAPQSLTVGERDAAIFSVGAEGSPQNFFWFSNNVQVAGNNFPTFMIPSAPYSANGAQIYVVVSNSLSFVTSGTATLTVNPDIIPPTIVRVIGNPGLDTVTITFSEDILASGVDPANFIVWPTGADPDADYLLTTGATLASPSNVVITTDLRMTGTNYSLRVSEIRDNSSQQNAIDPNPTDVQFITQNVLLADFDDNNIWKYVTLSNQVPSIPAGWETVGFDDSAWPEGPAGLGVDASVNGVPIRTATGYSARSEPTFFRRHFTLGALTNGLVLNMRYVFEDGAVVYINGQEAGRFNVAAATAIFDPADGTKGPRAAGTAADPTPISAPVALPLTNVFPGDNVIAVVVLQSGDTSTDIEMAIELEATIPQYPSGGVVISTQPAASTIINEGQAFGLSVVASGAVPITYQWQKGGVAIPGQTGPSFGVAAALPADAGNYTVAVSNSSGGLISSVAAVIVISDTTPPAFLSAVADTNLTNITLVFDERLNPANAENPAHYDVHLTAGGGNLTIISATLVNNSNVVLVTDPRTQSQGYTVVLSGVTDTAVALNPATPSTRPVICEMVILAPDASTLWHYDSSSNNLDATGWELTGYNDSAWPTALAGFTTATAFEITPPGFELRSTNMLAPNTAGGSLTVYYRVPFSLPASSLAGVTLHIVGVVDDGLVAYVNGVEAGRLRITNASPVSFTNVATTSSPETTESHPAELIVLTNLAGLHTGAGNLLAIELHQNAITSSDAVLSVQLVAGIQSFAAASPALHIVRNELTGQVTVSWSGGGILQSTANLSNAGTVWTDVPGNPNPYTFTPLPGEPVKFFSLR